MMKSVPTVCSLAAVAVGSVLTPLRADDTGLLGHWQLVGDAKNHSGHGLDGRNHGVDLVTGGFDGRAGYVEVPDAPSLDLGTGDFSIAVWVHTEAVLDDVVGDVVSKYDPVSRKGFSLSIKNHAGVTACQSNYRNVHFGIDNGKLDAKPIDHGRLGKAILVYGMAVFDGNLYAGTCVAGADESGRVFRYDGGTKWVDCGSPDRCNSMSSLAVHDGALYVGTSKYRLGGSALDESENPHPGGNIYRYAGGSKWVHCGKLPDVSAINGMVVYRGKLYVSSMYRPGGLFRYDGDTTWTPCGTPEGKRVESLTVYNGHLYATGYDEGAVYRYDGESWTHLGRVGKASQTYGFAVHGGELYVSEWPNAMVYRHGGGTKWIDCGRLGQELETMPLVVYNGKMYAGTLPLAEIYRYDGSTTWTRTARVDFTPDVKYRRAWSMAVYQGRLFVGTLPSGHVHSFEAGRNATYDRALEPGWRHIVAVKAGGQLRLYVDGKRVAASASFTPADYDLSNDVPMKIGFGSHDYFNGRMKDLRIYGRALSDREIAENAKR